jgi:hypothetical protein
MQNNERTSHRYVEEDSQDYLWVDNADDEDDNYYYEAAIEQPSLCFDRIYQGELLISEILEQDKRMMVLATGFMLIADIDCGNDVVEPLGKLERFVAQNGGSFRVYKTRNGMRYLQTDLLYHGANKSAIATFKELGSDPKYVRLCDSGKRFMARLTPKLDRDLALKYFEDVKCSGSSPMAVCHYLKTVGQEKIINSLSMSLDVHDTVCQCFSSKLELR